MEKQFRQRLTSAAAALMALGAREVYVFGSAARGTWRPGSDVDLAVSGLPPAVFFKAIIIAGDALGHDLDLVDLDEDTPFTRCLKEQGGLQRVV